MRKPQALKGNGKPHDVAVRRQAAFVIPKRVKTEIVRLTLGVDGIGLDSEWIRIEHVGPMVIAKSVQ